MSGLQGMGRLPHDTVRARRNAMKFASTFASMLGDGLTVDASGLIVIDLAADKGLEFLAGDLATKIQSPLICDAAGLGIDPGNGLAISGTELVVDLAATPGLEFSAGDLIAKVAAPIALDATGIHLDFGTGLQNDAGVLKTDDTAIDHDVLANFELNEHYLQTAITNVSSALATGLLKVTTGTGALSVVTDNSADWDTAFGWGDHAGLYDLVGTMAAHEAAFTHADIALNTTHRGSNGSDHSYLDQAVTIISTPVFGGLTLTGLSGVLKAAAGVVSGSADLNDLDDVNAGAPADDDVLSWDTATSKWIPVAAGAGGGGIGMERVWMGC